MANDRPGMAHHRGQRPDTLDIMARRCKISVELVGGRVLKLQCRAVLAACPS